MKKLRNLDVSEKKGLTQKRLQEILHYDPDTGSFTRKSTGKVAGTETGKGYLGVMIDYTHYYSHRLAWLYVYGEFPSGQIDHINRKRSDNRIGNLRDVSGQENHRNISLKRNNTSGISGVFWRKRRNKWEVSVTVDSKQKYCGEYKSLLDAVSARFRAYREIGFHENHGLGEMA